MKKVFKITGYTLLVIVLVIVGLVSYVKIALPDVGPAPEFKVAATHEQVERGRYLANSVTPCLDCHSTRDWSKFGGPIMEGTLGKGGEKFDQQFGFPGAYFSRNITPKGISHYTDGELFRVITTGVTKDGRAMFPVMPYMYFGRMDPEDIKCIIAYLRTLAPIDNNIPESVSDFPMNIIINTIPHKAVPAKRPDTSDHLAYGAYLVNACACMECHTKENKGQIIPELAFQGGREFKFPDGSVVRSANITPSTASGIGNWNVDAFVNRFKTYADSGYKPQPVKPGDFNSIMPWLIYCNMTRTDLAAIYTYLHSLPAKENSVEKFTPASAMAKK
jgi:cytochrome c2